MKSTISYSKFLAGMACALALAGCDAIKSVSEKPFADQPQKTVALGGTIVGLSSLRAVTLMNNGDTTAGRSFVAAAPGIPNAGPTVTPFTFGSLPVGSHYKIEVKDHPFGKTCDQIENAEGDLTEGVNTNIRITCRITPVTDRPRRDMTVRLPDTASLFTNIPGAVSRVRLTTEEEIFEETVTPGQTTVNFDSATLGYSPLINAAGQPNSAPWTVTASTTYEDGRVFKCVVSLPSPLLNAVASGSNPPAPPAILPTPYVGTYVNASTLNDTLAPCTFSVSGVVGYSQPAGTAYTQTAITGLKLALKDPQLNIVGRAEINNCTPVTEAVGLTTVNPIASPGTTTFRVPVASGAGPSCEYTFDTGLRSSTTAGLYEVVVEEHPAGQRCLVVNGGSANVFTAPNVSPLRITGANVFCRAIPATNNQLHGVFRLQKSTWTAPPAAPVVSEWKPFDTTAQNSASSNMLGLFDDGTFLYGTHGAYGQVEHGFYDYDPVAHTLRFTLVTDTTASTTAAPFVPTTTTTSQVLQSGTNLSIAGSVVFPANFSPIPSTPPPSAPTTNNPNGVVPAFTTVNSNRTTTPGISATPSPIIQLAGNATVFATQYAMNDVTFGTADSGLDDDAGDPVMVRTIEGTFGADTGGTTLNMTTACSVAAPCLSGGVAISSSIPLTPTSANCTVDAPCVMAANGKKLTWVLQEPASVDQEITGRWMTEDHRRIWAWDYRTTYGTAVGVMGGSASMNDSCFIIENELVHARSGFYTRRPSLGGCYPFNKPSAAQVTAGGGTGGFTVGANDSLDFSPFTVNGAFTNLPGYVGRMPGGQMSTGITPVSPVRYFVAPASSFFDEAEPILFPEHFPNAGSPATSLTWCTDREGPDAEVLGIRTTRNGFPIDYPLYFCRTNAQVQ